MFFLSQISYFTDCQITMAVLPRFSQKSYQSIDLQSMLCMEMHERFMNPLCLPAMHFKKHRWQRKIGMVSSRNDSFPPVCCCTVVRSKFTASSVSNFDFPNLPQYRDVFSVRIFIFIVRWYFPTAARNSIVDTSSSIGIEIFKSEIPKRYLRFLFGRFLRQTYWSSF